MLVSPQAKCVGKLVKVALKTVFRLQCNRCMEVIGLDSEAVEDIAKTLKGKDVSWSCELCSKDKDEKKEDTEDLEGMVAGLRRDIASKVHDLTTSVDNHTRLVEENNGSLTELKNILEELVGRIESMVIESELIKKDLKDLNEQVEGLKVITERCQ